jgi:hypothetical protein
MNDQCDELNGLLASWCSNRDRHPQYLIGRLNLCLDLSHDDGAIRLRVLP